MAVIYTDLNPFDPLTQPNLFDSVAIKASLVNLLSTRKGELPFEPDYGVNLEDSLFDIVDDITALAIFREIVEAIKLWEPRILLNLSKTTVEADIDTGTFTVTVIGQILGKENESFEFIGELEKAN